MPHWVPAKSGHAPKQTIQPLTKGDFMIPSGTPVHGFYISGNGGPLVISIDGQDASPSHGFTVDPEPFTSTFVPIAPIDKISIWNASTNKPVSVDVLWLQDVGAWT